VVKWIGIKKGDVVTNNQVVVLLDDSEYQARLAENDGQLAVARVGVEKARIDLKRMEDLVAKKVEMTKSLDDARLALASAEAQIQQILGARKLYETWIDWCRIRSPVDGVILEKLAKANELVTPQTFGGTRGPSTSLLAVADLNDLQVDIDVNESDLAKISMGQRCKVSPEAYPDRQYDGRVVEIAPEASRAKGTLQIKVQIERPDRYLTPELSAKVDFLGK
jgi:RND family efflux transporter MFP subunit